MNYLKTMKKNNKYEVLGVDLSELSEEQFKDFASSHFAYDFFGNELQAPTNKKAFKRFMEHHFGWSSESISNFREGYQEFKRSLGQ